MFCLSVYVAQTSGIRGDRALCRYPGTRLQQGRAGEEARLHEHRSSSSGNGLERSFSAKACRWKDFSPMMMMLEKMLSFLGFSEFLRERITCQQCKLVSDESKRGGRGDILSCVLQAFPVNSAWVRTELRRQAIKLGD